MEITKNTGFLEAPPRETDYIAGESSLIEFKQMNHLGDWTTLLPSFERQNSVYMDTMACFPGDTQVLKEDLTWSRISELNVGEKVMTHKGNAKRVSDVMARKVRQDALVDVLFVGDNQPIVCTPNHPFLTKDGWKQAQFLIEDDYLCLPKLFEYTKDTSLSSFETNPDALWFLGLYLAEGNLGKPKEKSESTHSVNGSGAGTAFIELTLNSERQDLIERAVSVAKKEFGVDLRVYKKKGSKAVSLRGYNLFLRDFLFELGGVYCDKKRLAKRLMFLDPVLQLNIARGWLDGDGHVEDRRLVGVSTSFELIRQFRTIFLRNGLRNSIGERKVVKGKKAVWGLFVYGHEMTKIYPDIVVEESKTFSVNEFAGRDYIYAKIRSVTQHKIKSLSPINVYNLEVDDDHSYIVKHVAVHNCVTFSALNSIESQIRGHLAYQRLPAKTIKALIDLGYFNEKLEFNLSDRFTAKMSGTTRQGNYFVNVWDSIRKHGVLPESDWPYPRDQRTPAFDWDDYYKDIPQELKDKALKFLELFDIKYEWVNTALNAIDKHLYQAPIQIASPTCPGWNTANPVLACSQAPNHATMVYRVTNTSVHDFDSYSPYRKELAIDYPISYAIKGVVIPK